jgi:hypothetical protein
VIQTKIDTKGQCYTRALQQLLTGVYVAELCLIGLFGIHKATGPSIMTAILLAVTIIYNITMNYQLGPLEKYLPADLQAADEETEDTPLLSAAEEGAASPSRVQRVGEELHVPRQVVDPVARFFEPRIFASHKAMTVWLADDGGTGDEVPEYSEDDIKNAYTNPAFTSQTPKVWLPKDDMGVSKKEIDENEAACISATDQGAWLDGKRVKWDEDDYGNVPLFKVPVKY